MDFSFNQEQTLLRESVRKFVEKDYGFEARRGLMKTDLGFSAAHWKNMADLGWTAIPFSEADGGLGGRPVDSMIVLEELGKGLVLEPFLASVIFAGGFLRNASAALKTRWLTPLIAGDAIGAVAYAEPDARFDLFHVATTARREGSSFVLDGKKIAVLAGHAADVLIVSARTSGAARDKSGITLFAVDAKSPGISRSAYRMVDGLHGADVTFSAVKVPAESVIGELDQGLRLLDAVSDETLIALGAEAMGILEVLYKSTVAYTKERKQFGVPIASFQVLQHRMVDMFMEFEQTRSMVYFATMTLDKALASQQQGPQPSAALDIAKAAAALKVQLGKSGRLVGQAAIQNFGGMGMTDELAVSHYFKRMTVIDLMLGNADYHLDRYRAL
jgi:alkylation response protein AidB-like acyl-CoA dehydrogenase